MLGFPRLAGRIGAERLIVIGAFAYAARAFVSSAAVEPWQIVAASSLAGFGYAFVYVGVVTWIAGAVPRSAQATAQGIFTGTTSNVGAIAGSVVGGAIAAALSVPVLFAISGVGYALGGILAWRALVRRSGAAASSDIASA
jgi:MFS family permease